MLIHSPRFRAGDLDVWNAREGADSVHASSKAYARHVQRAKDAILSFVGRGPCYCGVSWGKDSVVVAHLITQVAPRVPLVWIRVEPIENPDCVRVRDAFRERFPDHPYDEIAVQCPPRQRDSAGWAIWDARGTLENGFSVAVERHGVRYVSGIRGAESGARKRRMMTHGEASRNTCAPIGWWTGADVFAHLHRHRLPVHPAYAMSMGGTLDRERLRVSSLGGGRGTGFGRRQWESTYYRDEVRALFSGRPSEGVL